MEMMDREELSSIAAGTAGEWMVYVLSSVPRPRRTYCGVTNRWPHRLRQHNGEIKGGARATRTDRPWRLSALMCGFGSDCRAKSLAMRAEWFSKVCHYTSRIPSPWRGSGPNRRAFLLEYALQRVMEKRIAQGGCIRLLCCDDDMRVTMPPEKRGDDDDDVGIVIHVVPSASQQKEEEKSSTKPASND
jgi:predicted GIY-YIG superfamily endonuclease